MVSQRQLLLSLYHHRNPNRCFLLHNVLHDCLHLDWSADGTLSVYEFLYYRNSYEVGTESFSVLFLLTWSFSSLTAQSYGLFIGSIFPIKVWILSCYSFQLSLLIVFKQNIFVDCGYSGIFYDRHSIHTQWILHSD